VLAHQPDFCTHCMEVPLVCTHEKEFSEEFAPECIEVPYVCGFSR
jgi:hypothetical protein